MRDDHAIAIGKVEAMRQTLPGLDLSIEIEEQSQVVGQRRTEQREADAADGARRQITPGGRLAADPAKIDGIGMRGGAALSRKADRQVGNHGGRSGAAPWRQTLSAPEDDLV
ncbi:hypothetical protein H9Q09_20235 [Aurantimonas sp. DM33-3]|uniref:hypothetical protein n=1 Tax=Aurantimonas sp. DM33-3 TaxID=2766955 RepID=UPI001652A23A|nr:hypothetical protein [Aurantimonas sp. DM33-3]MBC6718516.1 hypothetical protein [Aurantimonas sp. DM33-3]